MYIKSIKCIKWEVGHVVECCTMYSNISFYFNSFKIYQLTLTDNNILTTYFIILLKLINIWKTTNYFQWILFSYYYLSELIFEQGQPYVHISVPPTTKIDLVDGIDSIFKTIIYKIKIFSMTHAWSYYHQVRYRYRLGISSKGMGQMWHQV